MYHQSSWPSQVDAQRGAALQAWISFGLSTSVQVDVIYVVGRKLILYILLTKHGLRYVIAIKLSPNPKK